MLPRSRYLEPIARTLEHAKDGVLISGDVVLVERLPEQEKKTKGGLYMPGKDNPVQTHLKAMAKDYPEFVRVLAVGEGYYDPETKESTPLDVKPGNILLVSSNSVQWLASFGPLVEIDGVYRIGITREDQYKMKFKSDEEFNAFFEKFQREVDARNESLQNTR